MVWFGLVSGFFPPFLSTCTHSQTFFIVLAFEHVASIEKYQKAENGGDSLGKNIQKDKS